ncbi:MAG: hypothetical protein ACPL09_00080 [Candidatus Methanodesulfokora sp.]
MSKFYALILLLLLLTPLTEIKGDNRPSLTYTFIVHEDGLTDIIYRFSSENGGASWFLVPKFENYTVRLVKGSINSSLKGAYTTSGEEFYFYKNFSFSYSPGTVLELNWSYKYGAMIIEPNGMFYSTQIGFSPQTYCRVLIYLPSDFNIVYSSPESYYIAKNSSWTLLTYGNFSANFVRIMVTFRTKKEASLLNYSYGGLRVEVPSRYSDIIKNITYIYEKSLPYIKNITDTNNELKIVLRFSIPSDISGLGTLGYTNLKSSYDIISVGNITLNMILLRMVPYELPQVMIHEMLHQYMWYSGLDVSLRWAHEGLADYLASYIAKRIGYPDAGREEFNSLNELINKTGGKVGFVASWSGGGLPINPDLYYAASLYVIKRIGDENGGADLYRNFFHIIKSEGVRVSDLSGFIHYLSKASGKDLGDEFKSMGFPVGVEISPTRVEIKELTYAKNLTSIISPINPLNFASNSYLTRAEREFSIGNIDAAKEYSYICILIDIFGLVIDIFIILTIFVAIKRIKRGKEHVFTEYSPSSPFQGDGSTS